MNTASITSLLNSLHTHLQSQTQLLPTFHAQLGLPASALEDDLRSLQKELLSSVEVQVDKRRKQVEHWMVLCAEIEDQCVRYTKALGGNIKATGSSIGELRKEQALPRRHELISEYQEKLRQVYHTKLEQLNTLTNRLNVIARTLGIEYFAQDILDPTLAAGEKSLDSTACRDVTPERFMKLEKELVRGKAEVNKRLHQLSDTFVQIDWLYGELGITPPGLDDLPSPSSFGTATSFGQSNVSLAASCSYDPFIASTPTPTSRGSGTTRLFQDGIPEYEYQQTFAKFVVKIEEMDTGNLPENQTIPIGLESVDPTPGLLQWAASLRASLEDTKRRREAHIQTMYDQLEGLWRRMGVADTDMDVFVETHKGSKEETVREYEEELERMLELKRERMGMFVESAREEIIKLWDDLMIGDDERADFAPFADDEFTEELLTIHEHEIKRLKEERRNKAPLLAHIKKYFEICDEEKELAAAASDQSRLTGRGARDPGRLLREEKMRKRVTKEKPRLEQELLNSIPAWEQETGKPFLVHGESFLQLLMEIVGAADQENRRKPARAGSVPPRATTPVNMTHGYMPGTKSGGGVVTPAVRSISQVTNAGSQSVPNKRQKLGENGTTAAVFAPTATRVPLGGHRGVNIAAANARAASPTKLPTKTPTTYSILSGVSSLPRAATLGMVVPKPGTQHHALGHGKVPTSVIYGAGVSGVPSGGYVRSVSSNSSTTTTSTVIGGYGRIPSASSRSTITKKSSRAHRESFKPRPSVESALDLGKSIGMGVGGKRHWDGPFTLREEEEY